MRAVLQRVSSASVTIDGAITASIGPGLLIFLGIEEGDDSEDISWLAPKISKMRIFPDEQRQMNLPLVGSSGDAIVVSQFTLHAATKKGNRPSFIRAARPEISEPLYQEFCGALSAELGKPVSTGRFGADMKVALVNDGPVTIVIDTRNRE